MKELPVVRSMEGLSLDEMIKIARALPKQAWFRYWRYDEEIPFEAKIAGGFYDWGKHDHWFSYDYHGKDRDIDIYLSNNSGGSLLSNYLAIRIMQGNVTLGFSGRLKESKARDLKDFTLYVDRCVEENMQNRREIEMREVKEAVERIRSKFLGEGI